MAGAIIMELAYGIQVKPSDDPHVETAEQGLYALSSSTTSRARIFDLFPMSMSYHLKRSTIRMDTHRG